MEDYMTIEEVAKHLRCSVKTVRRYTKLGLASYRPGGRLLFKLSDVEKFMDKRKEE